jgi:cellulose synthase/poly-beta-1,6-N-acetylglucosamine synthase-like glycosyltransferase
MKDKKTYPVISVCVPIHVFPKKIHDVRNSILKATTPIEIIYVVDNNVSDFIENIRIIEKIIKKENKGRGFMFAEGVRNSNGEIILFLHSDTILPIGWDKQIRILLEDNSVIGGGFLLKFDVENSYLNFFLKFFTFRYRKSKIMTGDRAIFVRSFLIKTNLSTIEIPIMEDIELSYLMKKNGKIVILNDYVKTSADSFIKKGPLRHIIKVVKCFLWYRLGGNLEDIFNSYYSQEK